MRIAVTGGGGFVGSNLVWVLEEAGHEVLAPSHAELELTDAAATRAWLTDTRPDAVIHSAIWNALHGLNADRQKAWDGFVGATRAVVDGANAAGAQVVLVSTDWIFDGTQGPATEDAIPAPVNTYGFLKAACELVVAERAERGTVARIAAVQGLHRARPSTARVQDAGFGYLVGSALDALREGRGFDVWEHPAINRVATPVLATDAAALMLRAIEREVTGTLHCVGAEHADRVELVRRAAVAFGFDPSAVGTTTPPEDVFASGAIPVDTRLDATETARRLDVELPSLDTTLARFREQLEPTWSVA